MAQQMTVSPDSYDFTVCDPRAYPSDFDEPDVEVVEFTYDGTLTIDASNLSRLDVLGPLMEGVEQALRIPAKETGSVVAMAGIRHDVGDIRLAASPEYLSISERLRDLKRVHDLTNSGLADRLDVSPSAVGFWIRGETEPSLETIWAIEDEFGVTLTAFRPGTTAQQATVARQRAGLSVRELADRLSVERSTIYRWENGDSQPAADTIERFEAHVPVPCPDELGDNLRKPAWMQS